jgi:hypothetical protein
MSLWRGILQQRRDEWASSLRGLDGIEAKPEIHNENVPVFRHQGTGLVIRRELRSEEVYLKDYTPFKNKKDAEYLKRIRLMEWLGSDLEEALTIEQFLAGLRGEDTAEEAYEAQDDVRGSAFDGVSEVGTLARTTTSIADIMWRFDERDAERGTFAVGGAGTGTVGGGGGGGGASDVADLAELGEDENLEEAVQNLKAYGITTKKDMENFSLSWEGDLRHITEQAKEKGIVKGGIDVLQYQDKRRILDLYRLRINVGRLKGEDVKPIQSRLDSFIKTDTIPTPEHKHLREAWAASKIPKDGLKEIFKTWKASAEGKAMLKANPGMASHALLAGRTNYASLYELLTDLGIKPPGYAPPPARRVIVLKKPSVGGGAT